MKPPTAEKLSVVQQAAGRVRFSTLVARVSLLRCHHRRGPLPSCLQPSWSRQWHMKEDLPDYPRAGLSQLQSTNWIWYLEKALPIVSSVYCSATLLLFQAPNLYRRHSGQLHLPQNLRGKPGGVIASIHSCPDHLCQIQCRSSSNTAELLCPTWRGLFC